jgi:branched-chain amino acid transport system substrate-binding protein
VKGSVLKGARKKAVLVFICISLALGCSHRTLLAAAGLSEEKAGVTDNEILIGNPNVQTGDNAFSGRQTSIGLLTYINLINGRGGVFGRKIRVVQCDDKYTVEGGGSCFEQLQKKGVFAIAGVVGSALLAKYIPLCTSRKMPLLGAYSGPQFVSDPAKRYIFTVRPGYQDEERQFADHMWKDAGIRKIAIIYQNDAYGQDHLAGLKNALKNYKTELVAAASYPRNTTDVSEAFAKVKSSNPEAVSLAANNHQCAAIIKMAREANWNPLFFINSGANVDGFLQNVGSAGDGVLASETVPDINRDDLVLVADYRNALAQYYPNEKPCFTSLRGYVDGVVLVEGLKRAGKDLTREKFVDALEKIHNLNIGLGRGMEVSYSSTDHFGLHKYAFGVVRKGFFTPIANWKSLKAKAGN